MAAMGSYPSSEEGLEALVQRGNQGSHWNGPHLNANAIPNDPWGHAYVYSADARSKR
ncbi:MAG: type II secretion system protein GspG [Acidobacteria bacterium]|nr:type II secretion system protein GspG [Acidobacteriota bacterium]